MTVKRAPLTGTAPRSGSFLCRAGGRQCIKDRRPSTALCPRETASASLMPAFIHRAAQAFSAAAIALAFTAAPALGADSSVASESSDPFALEAGDSSYPIGRVLTPETWARRSEPGVIRLAVSSFLGPNANYAVIKPTIRALQAEFGRDRVYAEVFSGDRIRPDRDDLVMSSSGTYRRAVGQGSRDLASLVSDRFPDPDSLVR